MKILVTGFEPFNQEKINPAWEAVKQLPDTIAGAEIIKLEVPTVFHQSAKLVETAIQQHQPAVTLHIGQAGGRTAITPERVAINLDDALIPDNDGNQPIDHVIQKDGAPAYFTQLPIKAMVTALKEAGLPASISNSAGTYVCNHLMYQTLYLIEKDYPNMEAGFIHVPFIPQQVADKPSQPAMSLTDITTALTIILETIATFQQKADLTITGGTLY